MFTKSIVPRMGAAQRATMCTARTRVPRSTWGCRDRHLKRPPRFKHFDFNKYAPGEPLGFGRAGWDASNARGRRLEIIVVGVASGRFRSFLDVPSISPQQSALPIQSLWRCCVRHRMVTCMVPLPTTSRRLGGLRMECIAFQTPKLTVHPFLRQEAGMRSSFEGYITEAVPVVQKYDLRLWTACLHWVCSRCSIRP